MNLKGPALPLSAGDVTTIAGYLGCEVAAVRAVLAIESRGQGFGSDDRPIILNEPHVFYRELKDAQRSRAIQEGLAYPHQGAKPYPKTQAARYEWLEKASAIDETAALRSCSFGLAQIMGFNHEACGFDTVQDFVKAMTYSEGAQLYAMARFIVTNGLQKHLAAKDWAAFAKGYNGAGYRKNRYDVKLAAAYAKRPRSEKILPLPATQAQLAALQGEHPDKDYWEAQHNKPAPEPIAPPAPAPDKPQGFFAVILAIIKAIFGKGA